jgi:biotin carboxyl carrier protein
LAETTDPGAESSAASDREPSLFREEALRAQAQRGTEAELIRISPYWVNLTFWIILAVAISSLVFALVARIDEYAVGPAVVRLDGRTELTARATGTVAELLVQPGQSVDAGQVLMRFYDAQEVADTARARHEFESELAKLLRDPGDAVARAAVGSRRTARELAEARQAERLLRAPFAGVVSDVRAYCGQSVSPGDILASMASRKGTGRLLAVLSGQYRPMVAPGHRLRFEIAGFRYAYQEYEVESVGSEVIGPQEAKRFLGPAVSDAFALAGSVILVSARLPASQFEVDGARYSYFDGMTGTAEVRVRSEPVALAFVPALRMVWHGFHHDGSPPAQVGVGAGTARAEGIDPTAHP